MEAPVRYGVNLRLEAALDPDHVGLIEGRPAETTPTRLSGSFKGLLFHLTSRIRGKRT